MITVAELHSCDGFSIEGADGLLGWVEETWLDDSGHPAALAIRRPTASAHSCPQTPSELSTPTTKRSSWRRAHSSRSLTLLGSQA